MKWIGLLILIALTVTGLSVTPAFAQSAGDTLTASVDRTELTTDDTLVLTLTLDTSSGAALNSLGLPDLSGFQVVGSSVSSELSMINGAISSRLVYVYQLRPTQAGTFTIPALGLDWQGQTLSTKPIEITVTQGNGAPTQPPANAQNSTGAAAPSGNAQRKGNSDFFIETDVDKKSAYIGEPIRYTLRLYSSGLMFGQPDYQAPKLANFWHEQQPEVNQYATSSAGMPYEVTELTTLLYPTTAGAATIDAATVTMPGGFFSGDMQVQSDPITVDVKPLPANAPADFNGAVGQFTLKAAPDRARTRVGEPVTLRVELSGTGNWGTLGDPKWPDMNNWRALDQKPQTNTHVADGQTSGQRVYERMLTPTEAGPQVLPAIRYTYFNPVTEQYETATTEPFTIDVAASADNVTASLPKGAAPAKTDVQSSAPTLSIKSASLTLTSESQPLLQQPLFALLFSVPVGFVAAELAIGARKRYLAANASRLRRSRALKRARRQLKSAQHSANVQMAISHIVMAYLEDQIQIPLVGMSHSTLAQVLQTRHVSPEVSARVIEVLFSGEASEYSQAKFSSQAEVVHSAAVLLDDLEQELRA